MNYTLKSPFFYVYLLIVALMFSFAYCGELAVAEATLKGEIQINNGLPKQMKIVKNLEQENMK